MTPGGRFSRRLTGSTGGMRAGSTKSVTCRPDRCRTRRNRRKDHQAPGPIIPQVLLFSPSSTGFSIPVSVSVVPGRAAEDPSPLSLYPLSHKRDSGVSYQLLGCLTDKHPPGRLGREPQQLLLKTKGFGFEQSDRNGYSGSTTTALSEDTVSPPPGPVSRAYLNSTDRQW